MAPCAGRVAQHPSRQSHPDPGPAGGGSRTVRLLAVRVTDPLLHPSPSHSDPSGPGKPLRLALIPAAAAAAAGGAGDEALEYAHDVRGPVPHAGAVELRALAHRRRRHVPRHRAQEPHHPLVKVLPPQPLAAPAPARLPPARRVTGPRRPALVVTELKRWDYRRLVTADSHHYP